MSHVRTQVREAVAEALMAGLSTEITVLSRRQFPMPSASLPIVSVHTPNEDVQRLTGDDTDAPDTQERVVDVRVTSFAKEVEDEDIDGTLDAIDLQIEQALAPGVAIGGKRVKIDYAGMQRLYGDGGERKYASSQLRFMAEVITEADSPDQLTA